MMLWRYRLGIALLVLPVLVSADDRADVHAQRAAELLLPFKKHLQAALAEGLADGPVAAIDVCRVQAPRIAAGLQHEGVRLGRASHRLRNPANLGPDWVVPIIAAYASQANDSVYELVELDLDRLGYAEPIYVQARCLGCHGDAVAPEVLAQINVLYPDDRATGFQIGDFRGVFWVEFPQQ